MSEEIVSQIVSQLQVMNGLLFVIVGCLLSIAFSLLFKK